MKKLLCLLLLVMSSVHAEYIDLTRGDILATGMCKHFGGKVEQCVKVGFEGSEYIVIIDGKGEKVIYKIDGDKIQFLWSRDML